MANRREVDLVVKAKDQTSQVSEAITKALGGLLNSLEGVTKYGEKTDNVLTELGKAVTDLDKVMKSASGADKIATEMARAEKAAASLADRVASTEKELESLRETQQRAAKQTAELRVEQEKLEATYAAEAKALEKAKAAQKERNTELTAAEQNLRNAERSQAGLTRQIEAQTKRIAESAVKLGQYQVALDQADKPTKSLQANVDRTAERLAKQNARLEELRARLASAKTSIETAKTSVAELTVSVEQNAAAVRQQTESLKGTKQGIATVKTFVREAAREERNLASAIETTEAALVSQREEFQRSETAITGLLESAIAAEGGLEKLAGTARGVLTQAFAQQRRTMLETKREWLSSEQAAKELADEMNRVKVPTREMAEGFARATASARQSKTEYQILRTGLQQLGGVLKESAADVAGLQAQQERFAGVQKRVAQAIDESRVAAAQNAAEIGKYAAETTRAATQTERVSRAARETKTAADGAAQATRKWAAAYRALYGEGRQALSFTQRLRGEVLSLISAYGGIFGVIQLLTETVNATQRLEAAQSRLNALYSGDQNKAGQELDFIRRNADRLGIDIGALADEYTKFAAATKGTNIEGEETRRIFLRVAEAGRVNSLSMDDMSGIFRALIQIASKGKVQLEELQGQLGDRLPGALQIMADGLGITVAELQALTKEGQVSSDALSNFANNLEERYGQALPDALKNTASEVGRFRNAVTQALLAFGQGGFIEGFNQLLRDLTETMQSADFKAFAATVSSAFGLLAKTLGVLATNFKLVTVAVTAFLAIKITPFVLAAADSFGRFRTAVAAAGTTAKTAGAAVEASAAGAGIATRAFTGLRAALAGISSGTAIGLVLTAIGTAISLWATEADNASEALEAHRKIVDAVKNEYDRAGGAVEKWSEKIKQTSILEATKNLVDLKNGARDVREEVQASASGLNFGYQSEGVQNVAKQLRDLQKEFVKAGGDVDEYRAKILALSEQSDDERIKEYATRLLEAANNMRETEDAVREGEAVIRLLNGTATDADKKLLGLSDAAKDSAKGLDLGKESANGYKDALDGIKGFIPELTKELERLKETAKLDALVADLMKVGPLTRQQMELIGRARNSINAKYTDYAAQYTATRGTPSGEDYSAIVSEASKLAQQLNLDVKDLLTVIHYESGFRKDVMGGAGGQYFGLFQASPDVREKYGIGPGSSIQDQIQALGKYLTDRGVKQGDGLLPIYAAINAGNANAINASDAANGGRPGTVLDKVATDMEASKAAAEGLLAAYGGVAKEAEKTAAKAQDQLEKEKEIKQEAQDQLKLAEVENQFKDKDLVARETAIEIEKTRQKLAAEGKTLDKETEDAIRKRVELQFREKANQEAINKQKENAERIEQNFNNLIQQRKALLDQAAALRSSGDTAGAEQATQQAAALQGQIDKAAEAAIAMWQKVGGVEADTAIAKIREAAAESSNLAGQGNAVAAMWQQAGQIIGDNLVSAFDTFAQAIANGENAWKAFGRAFQQAAAQILIDIGKMIVKQAVFNALSGVFGLSPGANGLYHEGTGSGTFGSNLSNRSKAVAPWVWNNAPKFHTGYNSGLGPNEMAAIVDRREAILTEDSPFHPKNQAATVAAAMSAGGVGKADVKIVNAIDSSDFVAEGVNTPRGTQAVLNMMRKNKSSFKEVLS